MAESLTMSAIFPVPAERLYDAWLSSADHTAFTGSVATVEAWKGGRHTAWDTFIWGENVELLRPSRIVQSWRTSDFPQGSEDSRLEVLLEAVPGGTRLTLVHTNIPDGQGAGYEDGWRDFYFVPMGRYFGGVKVERAGAPKKGARPAAKKAKAAAKKAKPAAKKAKPAPKKKAKPAPKKKAKPAPKKKAKPAAKKKGRR